MITNVNKKVICIKDIPSNIIEEAIFILKTDIGNEKKESIRKVRKELAGKEAENFLKEYICEIQKSKDLEKDTKYFKKLKLKVVLVTVIAVVLCYILFSNL